jgi:hypothetical protein
MPLGPLAERTPKGAAATDDVPRLLLERLEIADRFLRFFEGRPAFALAMVNLLSRSNALPWR